MRAEDDGCGGMCSRMHAPEMRSAVVLEPQLSTGAGGGSPDTSPGWRPDQPSVTGLLLVVVSGEGVGAERPAERNTGQVAAGRRWLERHAVTGGSVILVGEAALCERYRRALALAGIDAALGVPAAAARGLWRIARQSLMAT